MSATVFNFRAFESVREEAKQLGDNAYRAAVRAVIEEQKQGQTGYSVAGELAELRRRRNAMPQPPFGGDAA